jgi:hypothetical protein
VTISRPTRQTHAYSRPRRKGLPAKHCLHYASYILRSAYARNRRAGADGESGVWHARLCDCREALCASLLAIPLTLRNFHSARGLLWGFNIFGTLDLITAIVLANIYHAPPHMGAAYWIPAFWVPSLLVTHYVVFRILAGEKRATVIETDIASGMRNR